MTAIQTPFLTSDVLPVFCKFYIKTGTLLLIIKIDNTEPVLEAPVPDEEILLPDSDNVEFEIVDVQQNDDDEIHPPTATAKANNIKKENELKCMNSEKVNRLVLYWNILFKLKNKNSLIFMYFIVLFKF